jgi:hypothetical protein
MCKAAAGKPAAAFSCEGVIVWLIAPFCFFVRRAMELPVFAEMMLFK